jgi:hypothetical protein
MYVPEYRRRFQREGSPKSRKIDKHLEKNVTFEQEPLRCFNPNSPLLNRSVIINKLRVVIATLR